MLIRKGLKLVNLDRPVSDLQDNVRAVLEPIAQIPLLDSNAVPGQALGSGPTVRLSHKLGRAYRGYLVTKANGSLQVWDLPADNTLPTQYVVLRFSGTATTADFLVF